MFLFILFISLTSVKGVQCEDFTEQKGDSNAVACSCVNGASFVKNDDGSTSQTKCSCTGDLVPDLQNNACLEKIFCGEYTVEKNSAAALCNCVTGSSKPQGEKAKCQCDGKYFGISDINVCADENSVSFKGEVYRKISDSLYEEIKLGSCILDESNNYYKYFIYDETIYYSDYGNVDSQCQNNDAPQSVESDKYEIFTPTEIDKITKFKVIGYSSDFFCNKRDDETPIIYHYNDACIDTSSVTEGTTSFKYLVEDGVLKGREYFTSNNCDDTLAEDSYRDEKVGECNKCNAGLYLECNTEEKNETGYIYQDFGISGYERRQVGECLFDGTNSLKYYYQFGNLYVMNYGANDSSCSAEPEPISEDVDMTIWVDKKPSNNYGIETDIIFSSQSDPCATKNVDDAVRSQHLTVDVCYDAEDNKYRKVTIIEGVATILEYDELDFCLRGMRGEPRGEAQCNACYDPSGKYTLFEHGYFICGSYSTAILLFILSILIFLF